jgi:histone-lysine N-methyltransferase SETD7
VGRPDPRGQLTGTDITFIYPDLSTALLGQFTNGRLVSARTARLSATRLEDGILVPTFTVLSDRQFHHWPSSLDRVLCPPLQSDPYESRLVRVAASGMDGGGEGLFATQVLGAGTMAAFYNGIRIPAGSHNPHEATGYCIFIDWGKQLPFPFPWVKEGEQIDVPEKYQSLEDYTATLAHKANHSFSPNCEYTNFCHPCYGLLPAIRTTQEVAGGEELSVHYSLNMPVNPPPSPTPTSLRRRPTGTVHAGSGPDPTDPDQVLWTA